MKPLLQLAEIFRFRRMENDVRRPDTDQVGLFANDSERRKP